MFRAIILTTLLSVTPVFVNAGYSTSDYNPDYIPYNFDSAVDRQNCQDELSNFDADYTAIAKGYNESLVDVILISGVDWSLGNANSLFEAIQLYYSTEFKECIIDDDNRIKAEAKEAEFIEAVESCDFDYFNNVMSSKERMDTYEERMACEKKQDAEVETEIETVPVNERESLNVPALITPIVIPEPAVYQAPAVPVQVAPAVVEQEQEEEVSVPEEVTNEQATTSTSTPTETVEMTQEELDRLVEQRVSEALEDSEPEPAPEPETPSFFKRITNFLFGWWK